MTQKQKILQILRERGNRGIRSYERSDLRMLQMPVRIMELRASGYNIISEPVKGSREVVYKLVEEAQLKIL